MRAPASQDKPGSAKSLEAIKGDLWACALLPTWISLKILEFSLCFLFMLC